MVLTILALVPGCGGSRTQKQQKRLAPDDMLTDVNIPVAAEVKNFFEEEDLGEYVLQDQQALDDDSQYAWIEQEGKNPQGFPKVHFGFDRYDIESSEEVAVAQDIARMQELLIKNDGEVEFVINGNADHAAGSDRYNRILSERRAKTLKDRAVAAGIPAQKIKIVGRGSDVPEIINGYACTGDKDQQAPNRRDEVQVIAQA